MIWGISAGLAGTGAGGSAAVFIDAGIPAVSGDWWTIAVGGALAVGGGIAVVRALVRRPPSRGGPR